MMVLIPPLKYDTYCINHPPKSACQLSIHVLNCTNLQRDPCWATQTWVWVRSFSPFYQHFSSSQEFQGVDWNEVRPWGKKSSAWKRWLWGLSDFEHISETGDWKIATYFQFEVVWSPQIKPPGCYFFCPKSAQGGGYLGRINSSPKNIEILRGPINPFSPN